MTHVESTCAYCDTPRTGDETHCISCGARCAPAPAVAEVHAPVSRPAHLLVSFAVWLVLGAFGGYAYWLGKKVKAYIRLAIWAVAICSIAVAIAVHGSERTFISDISAGLFISSFLMILVLWIFDLTHLFRGDAPVE